MSEKPWDKLRKPVKNPPIGPGSWRRIAAELAEVYRKQLDEQAKRIAELEGEAAGLRNEVASLNLAIIKAGFRVMRTSGEWSIHDVSQYGQAEEAHSLKVATENAELQAEVERLKSHVSAIHRTIDVPKAFASTAAEEVKTLIASAALEAK